MHRASFLRTLAVLALSLLAASTAAAQVNIEQHRSRTDGTTLTLDASASLRSGNSDLLDVVGGTRLNHNAGRHTVLVLARVRYGKNNSNTYASSSFGHLRYTRWFNSRVASEAFGQLERDRFTLLQVRSLLGAGGRVQVVAQEHIEMYYGSAIMLELENLDESRVLNHPASTEAFRWSNYASFRWMINDRSSLSTTVYAQPRVDDFADVRLLQDAALEVGITERVALRVVLRLRFDNRPPDNLDDHDVFLENGVRVRL